MLRAVTMPAAPSVLALARLKPLFGSSDFIGTAFDEFLDPELARHYVRVLRDVLVGGGVPGARTRRGARAAAGRARRCRRAEPRLGARAPDRERDLRNVFWARPPVPRTVRGGPASLWLPRRRPRTDRRRGARTPGAPRTTPAGRRQSRLGTCRPGGRAGQRVWVAPRAELTGVVRVGHGPEPAELALACGAPHRGRDRDDAGG